MIVLRRGFVFRFAAFRAGFFLEAAFFFMRASYPRPASSPG